MTVKDKDHGYKALMARMKEASKGATVRAGIHSDDGAAKEGELTVIDIATFHEFGTSRIPARSFVGAWMDLHRQDVAGIYSRQMRLWLKGGITYAQVLGRVGAYMSGGMKKRIADSIPPPLAAVTILRKGSSVPLIDTGQMRNAITFSFTWSGGESKA